MSDRASRARETLAAWRAQRADRLDPLRFHFIEALERRAAAHDGAARQLLDAQLGRLIEAYAADLERMPPQDQDATTPGAPGRGPLGALVDDLASRTMAHGDDAAFRPAAPMALDEARRVWSRVRSESQLRQSQAPASAHAGPLNSGTLVHRSIALMRELSPGYLEQFLSYLDDLSWVARLSSSAARVAHETPQPVAAKKRARAKPRTRRE